MNSEVHVMLAGVISVFLALIFLTAGWHKLNHRLEFSGVVRNYRILPEWVVPVVALLLPVVELIVGFCLVTGLMPGLMSYVAFVLLVVFAAAIAVNVLRGRTDIDCGCFRPESRQHLSWMMVLRNCVLATAAWYAAGIHLGHDTYSSLLVIYPAGVGFAVLYLTAASLGGLINTWNHAKAGER